MANPRQEQHPPEEPADIEQARQQLRALTTPRGLDQRGVTFVFGTTRPARPPPRPMIRLWILAVVTIGIAAGILALL